LSYPQRKERMGEKVTAMQQRVGDAKKSQTWSQLIITSVILHANILRACLFAEDERERENENAKGVSGKNDNYFGNKNNCHSDTSGRCIKTFFLQ
jgi:hypothetical protein